MEIKHVKLTREPEQEVKCSQILSVTISGGNIIASIVPGDNAAKLAIVTDFVPDDAKHIATLHETHAVSHVFLLPEAKKPKKEAE